MCRYIRKTNQDLFCNANISPDELLLFHSALPEDISLNIDLKLEALFNFL